MNDRISFVQINRALRSAWQSAGRIPTWPAIIDPDVLKHRQSESSSSVKNETFAKLLPYLEMIGARTDIEVAQSSGCARSLICEIRCALQIPACLRVVITKEQHADCVRRIRAREPLRNVAAKTGVTYLRVHAIAKALGWDRSWTSYSKPRQSTHVGKITKATVRRMLDEGADLKAVAKMAGVSPQRIAQVAKVDGIPNRREHFAPVREARWKQRESERMVNRDQWLKNRARRKVQRVAKLRRYLTRAR